MKNHLEVGGYKTVRILSPPHIPLPHLNMFTTDKARSFSVRTYPGDTSKLLLLVWHHGVASA
jgi:hypothetical protein